MFNYLTEHFSVDEFTKSQTALRNNIDNSVRDINYYYNMLELCNKILQPLRESINKPIIITSGYRCLELNRLLGSKDDSQHTKGMAADIECLGLSNPELAKYIVDNFEFDQVILEFYTPGKLDSGWVHVSYNKKGNRKQVLTASRVENDIKYSIGINV